MSKRITTTVALLGAAGLFSGCNFAQPSVGCQVQDATTDAWQAVYTLTNPADASKSCGQLKNEALGVFKYLDPVAKKSQIAIRPESLAALVAYNKVVPGKDDPVETLRNGVDPHSATTLSPLADQPDAQALCGASAFTGGMVNAPAVTVAGDQAEKDLPAAKVTYTFESVLVYSAASAPGTQLEGTLKYADGTGCEVEYKVRAIWPQRACKPEAFANPTDANANDRCAGESGINPDFDTVCLPSYDGGNYCSPNPAKDIPYFK